MADLAEIYDKFRTTLLADVPFVALLGETLGVYRVYPAGVNDKPFTILNIDNQNHQTQISGTGVYKPTITLDIITINPWDADPIYAHLVENYTIPKSRVGGIASTNYVINLLSFPDMIEVTGQLQEVDSGSPIRMFTVSVVMRIVKQTA